MTVEAAIEPAAAPSIRPTATRVLLVTAVYVVAVVAAAIYPLVSPLRYAGLMTVEGQLVSVLNGAVWLAVLLIVFVRQPDGRLWKLIFVWSLASRIYAFSLRAGLARLEHRPAARDPRDRRVRAPGDCVPDGQPAQPVRPWRRAVRLRAPHRTGAARAIPSGRSRSPAFRTASRNVVRGLAERGDLRGHHERDDGVRRRDGGPADPDRAVAALARREPGRAASSAAGRRRLPDRGRAGRRRRLRPRGRASSPASPSSTDPPGRPCASSSR